MDIILSHCAGLDVHKKRMTACRVTPDLTVHQADGLLELKDFGTMTADLLAIGLAGGGWGDPCGDGEHRGALEAGL